MSILSPFPIGSNLSVIPYFLVNFSINFTCEYEMKLVNRNVIKSTLEIFFIENLFIQI